MRDPRYARNRKLDAIMASLMSYILPAVLLIDVSAARADFVKSSPTSAAGPVLPGPAEGTNPAQTVSSTEGQPVHWKLAIGFGNRVPLAFACRQIVPPAVKVTYGPGVNPTVLVNWRGGGTWNHVLRDTVKPLGLRLRMTYMAVAIEKNPSI
jgi:hypothetical protein